MHKYLRAVGFSSITDRKHLQALIAKTIKDAEDRSFTIDDDEALLAEYSKTYGKNMGITVCGEMDDEDRFLFDYMYPFFRGDHISTNECVTVERLAAQVSYCGALDDSRTGITLIFYLLNRIPYIMKKKNDCLPKEGTSVTFTGLSLNGTIMMPIMKTELDKRKVSETNKARNHLIEAARQGDTSAIETLTMDDMEVVSIVSKKIRKKDLFSVVDTYLMPYGVECDQYSILGEILSMEEVENTITSEKVYQMLLECKGILISICVNAADVFGEPAVGRRYKGTLWLQGYINEL